MATPPTASSSDSSSMEPYSTASSPTAALAEVSLSCATVFPALDSASLISPTATGDISAVILSSKDMAPPSAASSSTPSAASSSATAPSVASFSISEVSSSATAPSYVSSSTTGTPSSATDASSSTTAFASSAAGAWSSTAATASSAEMFASSASTTSATASPSVASVSANACEFPTGSILPVAKTLLFKLLMSRPICSSFWSSLACNRSFCSLSSLMVLACSSLSRIWSTRSSSKSTRRNLRRSTWADAACATCSGAICASSPFLPCT